jgi:carboxyl-terminal processing protease
LKAILERLQAEGVQGLVLDLRGNPGGLLTSAVEISDLFLTEGTIVSTRGRRGQEKTFVAKPAGNLFDPADRYPMAVLIDRYSASASEIVAAALQDHGRAVVVGERSFGKGSVQNLRPLEATDGPKTALKLTMASYHRPSGTNIHRFPDAKDTDDWGVRPTEGLEVPQSDDERRAFLSARRYRDIVPGKTGHMPDKLREKVDAPFKDPVLDKALSHLRQKLAAAKPRVG